MSEKKNEIVDYNFSELNDQKLFVKITDQMDKDILLSGLDPAVLNKGNVEAYLDSMKVFISDHLNSNSESLRALLYRVDVKESEVTELFQGNINTEYVPSKLSKILLFRILQKVIHKSNYR